MKMYGVLIPEEKIINKIWELRTNTLDVRAKTLPHVTIGYFGDIDEKNIPKIIAGLNTIQKFSKVELKITRYISFENKIAAEFDSSNLQVIILAFENIIRDLGVEINKDGKWIGDHMKIVRDIKPKDVGKMTENIEDKLPKKIIFDRMALLGYGCTENDILWEKKLI